MGTLTSVEELSDFIYREFHSFHVDEIVNRRFSFEQFSEVFLDISNHDTFRTIPVGESTEGRPLRLIKLGGGRIKVFLWSQMHGDESTATRALLDIMHFFAGSTKFETLRVDILQKLTIYILPMVNPDGAAVFTRENINGIDLNRDALNLSEIEAKILQKTFNVIQPDFAFNLHDQDPRYSLGTANRQATISFLAPPYNEARDINANRYRAMQLIAGMRLVLEQYIPGHIGKYSDEYEPNAFGDRFQELGAATILIESGGWKGDREKLFVCQLNVIAILSAFVILAQNEIESFSVDFYNSIPLNERKLFDLLLRDVAVNRGENIEVVDIGINYTENPLPVVATIKNNSIRGSRIILPLSNRRTVSNSTSENIEGEDCPQFEISSSIEEIGDLTGFSGLEEFDFTGCVVDREIAKGDPADIVLMKNGEKFVSISQIPGVARMQLIYSSE